jgi:hypothetical protein
VRSEDAEGLFERAEEFIWRNARLLDRKLFMYQFKSGSRDAVLQALLAYRNPDGGFGNALEPDIRCPDSQPVPAFHALEVLDEMGWDAEVARGVCDYLETITTDEGGVPFVLPSVMNYPRAPWWAAAENPPASINPTAGLAGLLHKHGVEHPWLDRATEFCWRALSEPLREDSHALLVTLTFLRHVPDRGRAEKELQRVLDYLLSAGLVADVNAEGYVKKPLDWAPAPDDPARRIMGEERIEESLNELASRQEEDGGWPTSWPAVGVGAEMEWRGWVTLSALKTLRAYGRLIH